jgi:hypothetical protein
MIPDCEGINETSEDAESEIGESKLKIANG